MQKADFSDLVEDALKQRLRAGLRAEATLARAGTAIALG